MKKPSPSKKSFQLLALAALFLAPLHSALADEDAPPQVKDVVIGLSDVFVPGGFNSEAEAYVVANGLFPNGCYRWKGAVVKNVGPQQHEIKASASVSQGMCLMVLIPFSKEIKLGKLSRGEHKLKYINGDGTYFEKDLKVD